MISQRFAIFDLDGTLVDSMQYWRNILIEYLQRPVPLDYILKISTMTVTESVELTVKTFDIPKTPETVFDEMCELMKFHYLNHVEPKKGIRDYLQKLHDNGVRMCIASASPPGLVNAAIEHFDMSGFFEFICSTEDGFPDKKSPDIYLFCAEKFNADPEQIAVFEDSYSAIITAKKAGFPIVAIYDDSHKEYWQEICSIADICKTEYL